MLINKAVLVTALALSLCVATSLSSIVAQTPGKSVPTVSSNTEEELRREIRELNEGQEAIRKELQEIKRLLLAREAADAKPAPPDKINIGSRPFRGNTTARIVMVEFSDYQCPYCGRFYHDTLPQ